MSAISLKRGMKPNAHVEMAACSATTARNGVFQRPSPITAVAVIISMPCSEHP